MADLDAELPAAVGGQEDVGCGGVAAERENRLVLQEEEGFLAAGGEPARGLRLQSERLVVAYSSEPDRADGAPACSSRDGHSADSLPMIRELSRVPAGVLAMPR